MHVQGKAGNILHEILGSHGSEYEDDCLLGCLLCSLVEGY
jgi:hypothetical protein